MASCQSCRSNEVRVMHAEGDLKSAVRKALRWQNARNLAEVGKCKERLASAKKVQAQHEQICEVVAAA